MNQINTNRLFEEFGTEPLLTPGEVARLFRVDPKSVIRWVKAGKVLAVKTPLGHHRFRRSEVARLLAEWQITSDAA